MCAMHYDRYNAGDPVRLLAGNYIGGAYRGECDRLAERALALVGGPDAR